ncbi:ParA family protein [Acidianus manzaensis]|uniref:CobQ/CobB/MinD/ParA nucleotide binding domain-containing protein n=1 Tax=Acidianus manzaensis TaxID=282676 RepID=A0A1W6K263_9CREN|nr:hypothetical protein [Acidianus manzaensis]ARM76633.1 hypothetical protein B6F84_11815 [Acidianus manzaensis]
MIRILVFSPKGGVGKSSIIYFLSLLFKEKYKVLIVDLSTSMTLSRLFNISGNIIDNDLDYFTEKDHISIVSFYSKNIPKNVKKIYNRYSDILKDKDIILVEYPTILNIPAIQLESTIFKETTNSTNYLLPISDPMNYIIHAVPNYINLIAQNSDLSYSILGLVINRSKEDSFDNDIKTFYREIFIIKFYREMLFKGFWNTPIPKDIYPIYYKINKLL